MFIKFSAIFVLSIVNLYRVNSLNNGLSVIPPRGWLAWERYRCNLDCTNYPNDCISETLFRSVADRLSADGWAAAGYNYVSLDDCWMLRERDPKTLRLVADPSRFPSGIKSLADYVHARGLKLGIYIDFGTYTCGGYAGSEFYLSTDAATFAEWGVDMVKMDGCYSDPKQQPSAYSIMQQFMNATARHMYFSCSYPAYVLPPGTKPGAFDVELLQETCNSWRMFDDIDDSWQSVLSIINWFGDNSYGQSKWAGPNHWNDADMLVIGNYGLSHEQQRVQMAIWVLIGSPLLLSVDLRNVRPESRDILINWRLLAISADPLGIAGERVINQENGQLQVWVRPLSGAVFGGAGAYAVAFLFVGSGAGFPRRAAFRLLDLGLADLRGYNVSDAFTGAHVGNLARTDTLALFVPPSGVQLVIATPLASSSSHSASNDLPQHSNFELKADSTLSGPELRALPAAQFQNDQLL